MILPNSGVAKKNWWLLDYANNPNVDLVSINSYIKFGQNLSFCSQDIEQKQNFGVNQGP